MGEQVLKGTDSVKTTLDLVPCLILMAEYFWGDDGPFGDGEM